MRSMKLVGVLGGTFDPVHLGHLHLAHSILEQSYLSHVTLVPSKRSPLRHEPLADDSHRLRMLELVTEGSFEFDIDTYELEHPAPSYTVNTIRFLRDEMHRLSDRYIICLIIGADAFMHFNLWHKWKEILKMCNVIVADRPGVEHSYRFLFDNFPAQIVDSPLKLRNRPSGLIWFASIQPLNISSSAIRYLLSKKEYEAVKSLLPQNVYEYIVENALYENIEKYK